MTINWVELTSETLPPYNRLVWVERYILGSRGMHHAIYIGARMDKPLSTNPDPSGDCFWFGRPLGEELYAEPTGMTLGNSWSDVTVRKWAEIEAPPLPSL